MACDAALADLMEYMRLDGVRVAAFDATNTTRDRRRHVLEVLKSSGLGAKRMFVESICEDEDVSSEKCILVLAQPFLWNDLMYCLHAIYFSGQKQLLEENIRKVKLSTPDYRGMDATAAIDDFRQRRAHYAKVYEPVDDLLDGRVPHVKIINSRQFLGRFVIYFVH